MSEMPELRYELHREIEDRHWWFLARRKIILDRLSFYLPRNRGLTVVEVGCGTGGNLAQLRKYYRAIGTEISPRAANIARRKTGCPVFLGDRLDVMGNMTQEVDGILLLDLLEHLQDPVRFLKQINRSLTDRVTLLVTVPAGQWFFSEHDLAFGHIKRYDRHLLEQELRKAGFKIIYISPFNTILYLPALIVRLTRKAIMPFRRGKQYKTDFWIPPQILNNALAAAMGLERFLLRKISLPFGLSIVAIAKKTDIPHPFR